MRDVNEGKWKGAGAGGRRLGLLAVLLGLGCGPAGTSPAAPHVGAGTAERVDSGLDSSFSLPADGSLPALRKLYTEHLGQLTETKVNPSLNVGITGTDLGATFERDGKLVFIFGDSWTPGGTRQDQDSIAWTTATSVPPAGPMPKLTWVTDANGQFVAPRLSGINLQGMNVPMEGVPVGSKTYVFFTTGWNPSTQKYSHSVLAEMDGLNVAGMRTTHMVPSSKFINVSVVVEGTTAFIYGSGDYRKSPVYLAKVELARMGDRSAWMYYRGGSGTTATFGPGESSAVPIVQTSCVGELSVRKWSKVGLYFMAYNCGAPEPRGITLRWARSVNGPWSAPLVIFDPGKDQDRGYEHFIHARQSVVTYDDGLSEPGREEEWGGEYGPYLIPRYFEEEPGGVLSLVYTMSSWNPYQVHLMRTRLGLPETPYTPPPGGVGLPRTALTNPDFTQGFTGWGRSGDVFGIFTGGDGRGRVTTYLQPKGDGLTGAIWQDFTVDAATRELSFFVHGGDAQVRLLRGGEVIRTTRGRRTNSPELPVTWTLSSYRGETLRLLVEDTLTGPWGFVGAGAFGFRGCEVKGDIKAKYDAVNGPVLLGTCLQGESATPDGVGRYNHFERGSIYWTPGTGAHVVMGSILEKWTALGWEAGVLGYPTTDELTTPDGRGRYNHFERGSIYWTLETGAHSVQGVIHGRWAALGWETGFLGYPVSDEENTSFAPGKVSRFQGGHVYFSPATGAKALGAGPILTRYLQAGVAQTLGFPTTEAYPVTGGRRVDFERGSLVENSSTGTVSQY
ncbi:DUF4185 domain-containing protein [Archangium violaceum]|uniref:DUF4185 domain-containing protein n=1 Tax=Archangium violaceum TaxID=83451 RepID=UPI0036DC1124